MYHIYCILYSVSRNRRATKKVNESIAIARAHRRHTQNTIFNLLRWFRFHFFSFCFFVFFFYQNFWFVSTLLLCCLQSFDACLYSACFAIIICIPFCVSLRMTYKVQLICFMSASAADKNMANLRIPVRCAHRSQEILCTSSHQKLLVPSKISTHLSAKTI